MMEELVAVVARHLDPPQRELEGSDESPSKLAVAGFLEFNRGDYFEQHEYLELAWLAEKRSIRELYQGILQVGVAFLQIERGNWHGALKMFRRGLPRLRRLPPVCQGVQLGVFLSTAEAIHAEISASGPEHIHEFDRSKFPHIQFENPYNGETPEDLGVSLPDEE